MTEYTITFLPDNIVYQAPQGQTLLQAQINAGLHPDAPCGGQGTCNKCLVNILSGPVTGIHKACSVTISQDMTVLTDSKKPEHKLLTKGSSREVALCPMVTTLPVTLDKCSLGDKNSDWQQLVNALECSAQFPAASVKPNLKLAGQLHRFLKEADQLPCTCYAVVCGNEILDLTYEKPALYLAAFDIGTTSIAGYLLNGETGEELGSASMLNPQAQYGADVIMRSNHALKYGTEELSHTVGEGINQLLDTLCTRHRISRTQIYQLAFAGNTCMHHLFLGILPDSLVHAPYNPAISQPLLLHAADFQIHIHPQGSLMMLPNIAGFVGADTVACLLASDFDHREKLTLMIDIGTNGEIVLGNQKQMICCSTAAGPALEGAKISCGMRGACGAIDHVTLENNEIVFSTIDNAAPLGICGSGLLDLIALLLDLGFIDETGRLVSREELTSPAAIANLHRLITIDEKPAFLLDDSDKNSRPLTLTQKDIREIQLAKGAIAAGITLLTKTLGVSLEQIEEVLIAGAFGNYMDPKSACRIGLIPGILKDKILPVGNAAGEGAKIAVVNQTEFLHTKELAEKTQFLELASSADFQDCFVDELEFPQFL